ncbi:uncharacterized protein DFL_003089 [Arthrobotrys flagrans]|uniref:Uncharacterized protein n=1 Tax=Arthrobotrys flagrans TaxID=97331 RepID=A0A437ACC8_ARTFL|nr:hypothetical protein DFL_003089 [Arthrobotrys flagrans]
MELKDLLRHFVKTFPAPGVYTYEFISVNIIGWLSAAVDDETAYNNITTSRSRLLLSLEALVRKDIPIYLWRVLVYFEVAFAWTGGMFGGTPKGWLLDCAKRIIQACEMIGKSHNMRVLEAVKNNDTMAAGDSSKVPTNINMKILNARESERSIHRI